MSLKSYFIVSTILNVFLGEVLLIVTVFICVCFVLRAQK